MQVTLDGIAQPMINYGYDCDDRLIGMSNNGSSIQSCSPTTKVTNGSYSTQFAFYYLGAGVLDWMLSDGLLTQNTLIDPDERTTERDYYSYPGDVYHAYLDYIYDPDGRVIDKNGSLATVNMPAAVTSATYGTTDQVVTWNGTPSSINDASDITTDPANSLTLTWTARNQMSTASTGATETYDGLGRRESSSGTATLNFEYDGSAMIGWNSTAAGAYNFTTMPGGGAVAGSYTSNGTTTTWLPLLDTDGSTLGLVPATNPASGPSTTYTYDPAGNPSRSGAANDWPFQYQGMEKEYTDPGTYYYTGGGQFYSPQLVRSLSETGATSTQGSGGGSAGGGGGGGDFSPSGNAAAGPSGGGFSPNFSTSPQETGEALGAGAGAAAGTAGAIYTLNTFLLGAEGGSLGYATPVVVAFLIGEGLFELFDDLFGGGSDNPPTPRQLRHARHPLYAWILGILAHGLIPDEVSEALGAAITNVPPLQKPDYMPVGFPGDTGCVPGQPCGPTQTEREPLTPSVCGNFFACTSAARAGCIFGCGAGTPEDVPFLCVPGCTIFTGVGCHQLFPCKVPRTFPLPGPP
jgi:hypothetical protein